MRVLITGAAGFIGSHLTDRLRDEGHIVTGVDNFLTGQNGRPWVDECDIVDRAKFYGIANIVRPELIIHCAASYSDPNLWHRDTETNVLGTINAVLAAKHHGARLFYFNTALPPISSYAISKIAGQQYIEQSGVDAITFRLANIYGPRNLSGPIPTFFKRITAGEPCTIVNTSRDTVYIDDLVRLVVRAIDTPHADGTFDVCSGIHYPIQHYYDAVQMALGSRQLATAKEAEPNDVPSMDLDPELAALTFGWTPSINLLDGVTWTVDWYTEHGVGETYTHLVHKG